MLPLSFNLLAWRWSTGLEHQPGPTMAPSSVDALRRNLLAKQPKTKTLHHEPQGSDEPQCRELPYDEPDTQPGRGISVIEVKNITCLNTHAVGLAKRRADFTLVQEHAADKFEAAKFKAEFRSAHRKALELSPCDPSLSKASGGEGAKASMEDSLFTLDPITDSFKDVCKTGRVMLVAFGNGKGG